MTDLLICKLCYNLYWLTYLLYVITNLVLSAVKMKVNNLVPCEDTEIISRNCPFALW